MQSKWFWLATVGLLAAVVGGIAALQTWQRAIDQARELGRYQLVAHPNYVTQQVYRLDNETGEVVVMSRTGGTAVLGKERD